MKKFIYSIVLIFVLILQSCNSSKSIEGDWVPEKPLKNDSETIMRITKIDEKIYKIEFWEDGLNSSPMSVTFSDNKLGNGFTYSPKEDKFYAEGMDFTLIRKKEK